MGQGADAQAEFTLDVADLIHWVRNSKPGWRVRLREVYRPVEMQAIYVERGASSTMHSNHLSSRAMDLILDIDEVWQPQTEAYAELGFQWERMSLFNRWGGRWSDGNHFERRLHIRTEPDLPAPDTEVTA